ncbi:MAG: FUSC family protein [Candidatus Binataceae bacterium]
MIDWVFDLFDGFFGFLVRELAPSQRRIIEAARNAAKTTIATGLAATMQTIGPFGPLFAFRIGQPGISLGFFEGGLIIATAAATQAAIVPITGKLLDSPGLIMAFVFVVFVAVGYLLSTSPRLFLILALVMIGTITTVYVGIFQPGLIGWGSTYTFDGILIATLVLVVLDTSIWPSPPELRLLESVATDLERTRRRLRLVGQRYLERVAAPLPPPSVTSTLAPNLALLGSVKEQMKPAPQRFAALLDSILTAERVHLEVERLATLADEPVAGEIRQGYREEIKTALGAVDEALAQRAADILAGLPDDSAENVRALPGTIRHLNDLSAQISLATDESAESELSNPLGFVGGLETIANLLEPRDRRLDSSIVEATTTKDDSQPRPFIDPAAFRFSVKLGAALTLGLLVGLTTQRADLQTILWSIGIVGQPNQYGAVVRKTLLRLAGCVMGGLAALAAMILVSENFDSLPAYLAVIFAVTMLSTYVAQSDEWLGYAGIQAGITFLICYVGLGPTSDVYKPLWRFWGIVLGVLTAAFVFLFLWPEYASDKLAESLNKLFRTALAFGREVSTGRITQERIAAAERRFSTDLFQVLNLADQARLERRRGAINSAAGVEAAAIITRIAYRFEVIARERLSDSDAILPENVRSRRAELEKRFCAAFESLLGKFELTGTSEQYVPALPSQPPISDLKTLVDELVADGMLEGQHWPPEARSSFFAQVESYRRLIILFSSLDAGWSKIIP